MPITSLDPTDLCLTVSPDSLGFNDTADLLHETRTWVGQEAAQAAARFGLAMMQPDFHLFVMGQEGSGRSSMMRDLMQEAACTRPAPPDLCYLHNFDDPAQALALRLPAGQGRRLREGVNRLLTDLQDSISGLLAGPGEDAQIACLDQGMKALKAGLAGEAAASGVLCAWLERATADMLASLGGQPATDRVTASAQAEPNETEFSFDRYRVNLVVDNAALHGAPVLIENNPTSRQLFGGIEYQQQEDSLVSDFSHIRAGSLMQAHGGYLMLSAQDLLAEDGLWDRLRRFLRSGQLQMDEPGTLILPMTAQSMRPEPVTVEVKLVLLGSAALYQELQEGDPEFLRRFSVKVELAPSMLASAAGYRAWAVWMAHTGNQRGLPPLSAAAVARVLEQSHREEGDQTRQSANLAGSRALQLEAAELCRLLGGAVVGVTEVEAALAARARRHQTLQLRLQAAALEGERLIAVTGSAVGQVNVLTLIDQGDYRFGLPVRVSARTYAGGRGLLNVEREVELSGPVHDKGVLILQAFLGGLFAELAPLALQASLVFEQEYQGIEGDSASCAECLAILSSLSGLPLRQGIALTGALNQHGEVMPVDGVNEKIEGFFQLCEASGLDGTQGVLMPQRNRRHLMLARPVVQAVSQGRFHIYTMTDVCDGLDLLTGLSTGQVLARARRTLLGFRRACLRAGRSKPGQNP